MQKRSSNSSEGLAATILQALERGEAPPTVDGKNPLAMALGRLGGLKGGKARAASLTAAQRSRTAKKAARARWNKG